MAKRLSAWTLLGMGEAEGSLPWNYIKKGDVMKANGIDYIEKQNSGSRP